MIDFKKRLSIVILALVFMGCGSAEEDVQSPAQPLDLGFWSPGEIIPSWLIRNGSYESGCLTQQPFVGDDGRPIGQPVSFKTLLTFNVDVIERSMQYFEDSSCTVSRHRRGERARVRQAHRTDGTANSGRSGVVYHAYEQARLIQSEVYLSQSDADFLNVHKVCRDQWIGESFNNVLGLNEEKCRADIEAIPDHNFDRAIAQLLLLRLTPYSEFSGFTIEARQMPEGISVRLGSGLLDSKVEHVFTRVK